jgi:hypothetical protein
LEIVERQEKSDFRKVLIDEVLQEEEAHVPLESAEQREELLVPGKALGQGAALAKVMPTYAL